MPHAALTTPELASSTTKAAKIVAVEPIAEPRLGRDPPIGVLVPGREVDGVKHDGAKAHKRRGIVDTRASRWRSSQAFTAGQGVDDAATAPWHASRPPSDARSYFRPR
jgi:hypothetical protein